MVERAQNFFDGSERVESVKMVDVDVIGAQASQAGFAGLKQMMARGPEIVRPFAHAKRGLGGNQDILAASCDGFAEDFFGEALRVDVGGVEQIDAGLQTNRDQAGGFGYIASSPGAKEISSCHQMSRCQS